LKLRLLISTLLAALLVVGSFAHASTHELAPDSPHELVECYGCNVVSAADASSNTTVPKHTTRVTIGDRPVCPVAPAFNNYSSRAPPRL